MEATEDPERVSALDQSFHAEIARVGGNPTLGSLLGVFRARSRAYQVFTLPDGQHIKRASDEDHRAIATALANRDPVAASGAAAAHVAHTEKWLTAFLQQQPAADGDAGAAQE